MQIAFTLLRIFDVLLPPRGTERLARELTPEALEALARPDGTLPYHEHRVRALVWEIKYRKNKGALGLAGSFLAQRALGLCEESLSEPVLVPVPMHSARRKARGYNQTELLCEAMMNASPGSFAYAPHAIVRTRNTTPQQGLPKYRRVKNILGAMETADARAVAGKTCVIVDDVSTTGATSAETKRALLNAGARDAYILSLAHS